MADGEVHGIQVEYVPPLPPPPGKIRVKAPLDAKGTPLFPHLHLSPEMAEWLVEALNEGLRQYLESGEGG